MSDPNGKMHTSEERNQEKGDISVVSAHHPSIHDKQAGDTTILAVAEILTDMGTQMQTLGPQALQVEQATSKEDLPELELGGQEQSKEPDTDNTTESCNDIPAPTTHDHKGNSQANATDTDSEKVVIEMKGNWTSKPQLPLEASPETSPIKREEDMDLIQEPTIPTQQTTALDPVPLQDPDTVLDKGSHTTTSIRRYINLAQPDQRAPTKKVQFQELEPDTPTQDLVMSQQGEGHEPMNHSQPDIDPTRPDQEPSVVTPTQKDRDIEDIVTEPKRRKMDLSLQDQSEMSEISFDNRNWVINHYTGRVQWNGEQSSFESTKRAMESLFVELGCIVLLQGKFQHAYIKGGLNSALKDSGLLDRFGVTRQAFEASACYLHRWVSHMANYYAPAKRAIDMFSWEKDGLRAWIELVASQDSFLCSRVRRVAPFQNMLKDPNHSIYSGRQSTYNNQILDAVYFSNAYTNQQRLMVLINNLKLTNASPSIIRHCTSNCVTLSQCVNYLQQF